jgi:hypothetical protein
MAALHSADPAVVAAAVEAAYAERVLSVEPEERPMEENADEQADLTPAAGLSFV